jgi:hypothetical protein
MNENIFQVLDAIAHGKPCEGPEAEKWIEAFRTIRWVTPPSRRLALTADGLEAHRELKAERRRTVRVTPA